MNPELQLAIVRFNREHPILELLPAEYRVRPSARTSGGEYHGPCPLCGGKDRFMAWPEHPTKGPTAYCRQCAKSGDALAWHIRQAGRDPKGDTAHFLKAHGYLGERHSAPREITSPPTAPIKPQEPAFSEEELLLVILDGDAVEAAFAEGIASADFFDRYLGLPQGLREALAERQAMIEYSGGIAREDAEALTLSKIQALVTAVSRGYNSAQRLDSQCRKK